MGQTIYSHPISDEVCVPCGHRHPMDDGSGISPCCGCGHPDWDPQYAAGGRIGYESRMQADR